MRFNWTSGRRLGAAVSNRRAILSGCPGFPRHGPLPTPDWSTDPTEAVPHGPHVNCFAEQLTPAGWNVLLPSVEFVAQRGPKFHSAPAGEPIEERFRHLPLACQFPSWFALEVR